MWKKTIAAGAIFAGLSVCLGAFGAHGLRQYVIDGKMPADSLQHFETAARYQMYHAIGLIIVALLAARYKTKNKLLSITAGLFITGIILFSGSLYLLSTKDVLHLGSAEWLGPVTPIGGACFISGWALLAIGIFRKADVME